MQHVELLPAAPPRVDRDLLQRIADLCLSRHSAPAQRPFIGIPMAYGLSQQGYWRQQAVLADVVRLIEEAGGDAYPISCRPLDARESPFEAVWQLLRRCDGLLLPGGAGDVTPAWYRKVVGPHTALPEGQERWEDWWKIHLAQMATLIGVPLLAICQGMQYWNSSQGGTLIQDLPSAGFGLTRHRKPGPLAWDRFQINLLCVCSPVSRLAACADGKQVVRMACMHHQAVRHPAPGLLITAREPDGVIAALERPDAFFGLALQGHIEPDMIYHTESYARAVGIAFIQAASRYGASRRAELEPMKAELADYLSAPDLPQLFLLESRAAQAHTDTLAVQNGYLPSEEHQSAMQI